MKQARTERGARLHGVYRAAIETVAFYLNEDPSFVEEGVLDSEHHLMILDNFFAPGGPQCVIFNCADRSIPAQGKATAELFFSLSAFFLLNETHDNNKVKKEKVKIEKY